GAGNLQQAIWLFRLADPRRPGLAFTFLSGKALRAVVPFLLVVMLLSNLWLATTGDRVYRVLLGLQLAFYAAAVLVLATRHARWPGPARWTGYFVEGHVANLLGSVRYLAGLDRGRWQRAAISERVGEDPLAEPTFTHPLVEIGKRSFDVVVATLALLLLAVLFTPIAVAITLDSK